MNAIPIEDDTFEPVNALAVPRNAGALAVRLMAEFNLWVAFTTERAPFESDRWSALERAVKGLGVQVGHP